MTQSAIEARVREVLDRASRRDPAPSRPPGSIAGVIDHTLLSADATRSQIDRLCEDGIAFGFFAVCVNPCHVRQAAARTAGSTVKVVSVIGFPLGASVPEIKRAEAARALDDGARELDLVIPVGALKEGREDLVSREIEAAVEVARDRGGRVKVILETGYLTDEEKVRAAWIARDAGAQFVKTSTGFGPGGATPTDVAILREAVGPRLGVKASGGIRTLASAHALLRAGADRLGTTSGVRLVEEERAAGSAPPEFERGDGPAQRRNGG